MPETRTVAQIDRDLAELRRRRIKARVNGEIDLIIVLSQAINRALSERWELTRAAPHPR